jgi:uncharacterized membrane protein
LRVKKRIYLPHNYSVKLILEAIIVVLAIIIPGGLLIYFGWKACKRVKKKAELKRGQEPPHPKNRYPH